MKIPSPSIEAKREGGGIEGERAGIDPPRPSSKRNRRRCQVKDRLHKGGGPLSKPTRKATGTLRSGRTREWSGGSP